MRVQYLREIVSYLEAMKSSCLGVIPTREEMGYYMMLSRGLDHRFMSCSVSREACVEGAGKMKQSSLEELRASLKAHLVSVCKSQMKFYEDGMKESASIIKLVRSAVMAGDDERDVEDYNIPTDEDVKKVKEFLGEPRSEQRLRQLNELIVILNELLFADLSISSMLDAGREAALAGYRVGEDCCEIVARELLLC